MSVKTSIQIYFVEDGIVYGSISGAGGGAMFEAREGDTIVVSFEPRVNADVKVRVEEGAYGDRESCEDGE